MKTEKPIIYNDGIKKVSDEVRVVKEDGNQMGVMDIDEAIDSAFNRDKDLVLVAKQANPPVAKIIEFGKYRYKQNKKRKKQKGNKKKLKEIRFTTNIQEHDIQHKLDHVREFLEDGNDVKLTVQMQSRRDTVESTEDMLYYLIERVDDLGKIKKDPVHQGKHVFAIVEPDKDG